jgi:hypothetical protein
MNRNGCRNACEFGSEICIECQEVKAFKQGWDAVVLLHDKVGASG